MSDESNVEINGKEDDMVEDKQQNNNAGGNEEDTSQIADQELEEMRRKIKEMEEEHKKLEALHNSTDSTPSYGDQEEIDARSVFVGNVDYTSTQEEILGLFVACGTIHRITILNDKATGHPKGCCYVEFVDKESVANALKLTDSTFKDRPIKVTAKRTNLPQFMRYPGGGRGGRGGPMRGGPMRGGRGGGAMGRGRGGRGGGRGGNAYHPYS